VTCIDPWCFNDGDRLVAKHYLTTYGDRDCHYSQQTCVENLAQFGDRIELIKTTSPYFHTDFAERKPNLFFIDGDHSGDVIKRELKLYYNHLAPGGTMLIDDYQHPVHKDLSREVRSFVLQYNLDLVIVKEKDPNSQFAIIEKL